MIRINGHILNNISISKKTTNNESRINPHKENMRSFIFPYLLKQFSQLYFKSPFTSAMSFNGIMLKKYTNKIQYENIQLKNETLENSEAFMKYPNTTGIGSSMLIIRIDRIKYCFKRNGFAEYRKPTRGICKNKNNVKYDLNTNRGYIIDKINSIIE